MTESFGILMNQETMWVAVASAGPYGSHLYLAADIATPTSPAPNFLWAGCSQPTVSKHWRQNL